jgi:alkanesulfonate monooxygenase SsuD/methylene tetrahydromethanopterin reductase-like flavin-dependent oxidoreductase (luciferase family)
VTRYSVLLPFVPSRPEHAVPFAAFVQHRGAYRLWQGQSYSVDSYQVFAYLAAAGFRIPVGTGISLMPLRHPLEAALQARSLAAVTSHPVVAGFSLGPASVQRILRGAPYPSPLAATREYLTIVRALLAGDRVAHDGAYFTYHGDNLLALPRLPVEVGLGVLRPRMARLAGELADTAITWLTPPGYLAGQLVPALREGAGAAGRAPPRLVAMVPVALREAKRDPVELALASNEAHLRQPHYRAMLRRAGVAVDPADPRGGARSLVGCGAFGYGDPAELAEQLDAYRAAGVDEIVVNMSGVGRQFGVGAALADLATLFTRLVS